MKPGAVIVFCDFMEAERQIGPRSSELNRVEGDEVSLDSLKAAKVVRRDMKRVRIMLSGDVSRAVNVKGDGIKVTKGARAAIEAAGGSVA